MEIREALGLIGLNEKEAAVYTALLQLGRASAYSVSTKSGLKKPTTYVILDELIRKGLALRVPREKKQLFAPRPAEEAFAMAEERLALAKKKLPELLALTKGEKTKVNVVYFEGVKGIQQMLEYGQKELRDTETVGFYATSHNAPKELNEYFLKWNEDARKRGITTRGIVPEHPFLKQWRDTDKAYSREMKVVPAEHYSSEIAIDTIKDIVRIHDYKNLQGVIIESPDVAKTIREIFEMVWKKTA